MKKHQWNSNPSTGDGMTVKVNKTVLHQRRAIKLRNTVAKSR